AYLGLGPGAHSYLPPHRFWNIRDWGAYRERVAAGVLGIEGQEEVTGSAAALERIWLGLRRADGLALASLDAAQQALAEAWLAAGWAVAGRGRLRLTWQGWLLLDRLAVDLAGS